MANQQRPGRETQQTNGLAHEMDVQAAEAVRAVSRYPQVQGYLLLTAGIVLLLFSIGFFPILKWLIFAAGVALAVWGAAKSNLIENVTKMIKNMRNRFEGSSKSDRSERH